MEDIELIRFNEKRDFSELFSATFSFIKQEFKLFFTCLLIYAAPALVIAGILYGFIMNNFFSMATRMDSFEESGFSILGFKYLFFILVMMIAFVMIYGITLGYIKSYIENEGKLTRDIVWNSSKQYFLKLIGFGFVISIIVFFASILFIIPGIYFSIALSLVFTIGVLEDETLGKSISRSMYLIKDNWWVTFGGLIIIGLITYIIVMIFSIPNVIMVFFNTFLSIRNKTNPGMVFIIIQIICSLIYSMGFIMYFIPIIYLAFQYHNLVERKEEPTLLDDIESIGTELQ